MKLPGYAHRRGCGTQPRTRQLPPMYERAGLTMIDTRATIKTGRPGSPVWRWLSTYFLGIMDELGGCRPFTPMAAKRLRRHWLSSARKPASLLIGPALIDVVGRKS